jgi:hypothetical protein
VTSSPVRGQGRDGVDSFCELFSLAVVTLENSPGLNLIEEVLDTDPFGRLVSAFAPVDGACLSRGVLAGLGWRDDDPDRVNLGQAPVAGVRRRLDQGGTG